MLVLLSIGLSYAAGGEGGHDSPLGVDIRVVIVQAMGFIVVFWVLNKFLFGPIGNAMDERKTHIKATLDKVERDRVGMEKLKSDYEHRLQNVEIEARARIQEAIKKAEQIGEEVKARKQAEADQFLDKARVALDREYDQTMIKLKSEITELALTASSILIQQEMSSAKHRELIEKFIDELELKPNNG